MKSAFILLTMVFASVMVSAATEDGAKSAYLISSSIFVDGKLVSKPRISVLAGEAATVTQSDAKHMNSTSLKVVATESDIPNMPNSKGILLNMDVYTKRNGHEIRSTPQLVLQEGRTGSIEIVDDDGKSLKIEGVVTKVR